ncbi:MAG TPA: proline--tRNA ligase [Rhodobiaceae bacterium]|nr:proline--tRNA ligase [Rhodobiaceae bacterium]|tara:strand:- start:5449 stop:6774 length:1326 start_codon:yes stop_codon:yes gene_type:complete
MRLSEYFLPTLKENPSEAQIVSHRLMLRAGMVRQTAAGIYSWLPLGLRVLKKIEQIIREEQDRAGAIEVLMPTLQPAEIWRESGRYDDYGKEMLRITDRHERNLVYGPTNEELITQIFRDNVKSYRELPKNLYHIQWKFRDEIRPRFGVMRGREFLMKDGYSFDIDEASARHAYQKMFVAYLRSFRRMGLKALPMAADTGPIGGDLSHEFIILAETGESEVFCHADVLDLPVPEADYDGNLDSVIDSFTQFYARTDELHDADKFAVDVPSDKQVIARGIEVGHIFYFGTKYSEPMKAMVAGPDGKDVTLHSGSYGIGVSRLVGGIIEASHDDDGIIWPWPIAPFHVGLVNLKTSHKGCHLLCEKLNEALAQNGLDVLYDNRDERVGTKFSDMDLIGLPWQAIVGPRGAENDEVEVKNRATGEKQVLAFDAAVALLSAPPEK